jgi:hypothetical protein
MVAAEDEMPEAETAEMRGGVVSLLTVTMTAVEVVEVLDASLATAVSVWLPFAAVVVVHETE